MKKIKSRLKITHLCVLFSGLLFALINSIMKNPFNIVMGIGLMIYALGNYWREEYVEEIERKLNG